MSRRTLRQHHATKPELLPALLNAVQDAGGVDDHRKLEYLIQVRNKDPNQRTAEGETPLMAAALAGAGGMTACLLSHGANPALLCTNGSSALSAAAFACSPRIVKMLLHHGNEETALQHGLERLLQTAHAGLEAHRVSVYGTLPAHDLCNMEDHYKHTMMQHHSRLVVQYLTEWFSEQTASGQAIVEGSAAVSSRGGSSISSRAGASRRLESLVAQMRHASRLVREVSRNTLLWFIKESDAAVSAGATGPESLLDLLGCMLMWAAREDNAEAARLVLETGRCPVGHVGFDGSNALHFAALHASTHVLQLLLSAGWDVNARSFAGDTPVMAAAREGHAQAVRALIDAGAIVSMYNWTPTTALCLAAEAGHCDILTMLLDAGAEINNNLYLSGTALMYATKAHHPAAVQLLLDRGADPNLPDACGRTPLLWASNLESQFIINALKRAGGKAPLPADMVQQAVAEAKTGINYQAATSGVLSALIPNSKRVEYLERVAAAEQTAKGRARSGRGRSSGIAAARAAAGDGGSSAAAGASSQPERSSEEADRIAAQLLAEEEEERAKAQAAQAKKGKRARQKAQARAVEAAMADEEAAAAERERQEHQQEELDAGASSSNGAAAAVPAADAVVGAAVAVPGTRQPLSCAPTADAAVQQLAGLSMGSAPAPAAPLLRQPASSNQPSQPAAPIAQQQQPSSSSQQQHQRPGNSQQQQQPHGVQGLGSPSATAAHENDERLCVVCMEGQRCMVLVPCGHLVMCQECCAAVEAASNECPMCRTAIIVAVALNL